MTIVKSNEVNQTLQFLTQKDILSFKEALIYLDVSKSLLYKLTSLKRIEFSKPNNGKLYFKKEDLNKWLNQNRSVKLNSSELKIGKKIIK